MTGYDDLADLLDGKPLLTYGACKECGEFCEHIPTHVKYRHQMTMREYITKYPQPLSWGHQPTYLKPSVTALLEDGYDLNLTDITVTARQTIPRIFLRGRR